MCVTQPSASVFSVTLSYTLLISHGKRVRFTRSAAWSMPKSAMGENDQLEHNKFSPHGCVIELKFLSFIHKNNTGLFNVKYCKY